MFSCYIILHQVFFTLLYQFFCHRYLETMTSSSFPALCSLIQILKQEEQEIAGGSVFLTAVFHLLKKIPDLSPHT